MNPHTRMPVLFIGHGSPMNCILKNDYTDSLSGLGQVLPRPKSIMVISAHWQARAPMVSCLKNPEQIYDFYGFPPELYRVRYHCPGAPEDAERAARLTGHLVSCTADWGLDHASWAVLTHMYPEADIPVFEMSLDAGRSPRDHYELGRSLAGLRGAGVLILGSGNIVHNLGIFEPDIDAPVADWSIDFDEKVKSLILKRDHGALINYSTLGASARLAVPTNEHYLPMLYALSLLEHDEEIAFTHEGFQNGTVSMRCFRIG